MESNNQKFFVFKKDVIVFITQLKKTALDLDIQGILPHPTKGAIIPCDNLLSQGIMCQSFPEE
jgi:hypothetical protein